MMTPKRIQIGIVCGLLLAVLFIGIHELRQTRVSDRYEVTDQHLMKYYHSLSIAEIYRKLFGVGGFKNFQTFYTLQKQLLQESNEYNVNNFPTDALLTYILEKHRRIDYGIAFLTELIMHNDRLKYYDLYIKLAKKLGYVVTDYNEYLTKYRKTNKKVLILRHDIDIADKATEYMFAIEKANYVKATYYFRWSSFDKALIKRLADDGFEVGLHYETIATYCLTQHKYKLTAKDIAECRRLLKQEIKRFKHETGINIRTIASHGNPINKQIGIPNFKLLAGQRYTDFGIIGETYDHYVMHQDIKSYICDSEITKNEGWSYPTNPMDSLLKEDRVIEFLSHPSHWVSDQYERAKLYMDLKLNLPMR